MLMPFNSGALPIFLRLFDKYAASSNWEELIEGLDKRYRTLYSQKKHQDEKNEQEEKEEENPFRLYGNDHGRTINSLEDAVVFAA